MNEINVKLSKLADVLERAEADVKVEAKYVKKAWTIEQLKFAHEMCQRERFMKLNLEFMAIHGEFATDPKSADASAFMNTNDMVRDGGLIPWMFLRYSRKDFEQPAFENPDHTLAELIDFIISKIVSKVIP